MEFRLSCVLLCLLNFCLSESLGVYEYEPQKVYVMEIGTTMTMHINKSFIKPSNIHYLRIHFVDALSVKFDVKFKCKDTGLVDLPDDQDAFIFFDTFANRVTEFCKNDTELEHIEIELTLTEIASRLVDYSMIISKVQFIVEVQVSLLNTRNKFINIVTNKGLLSFPIVLLVVISVYIIKFIFDHEISSVGKEIQQEEQEAKRRNDEMTAKMKQMQDQFKKSKDSKEKTS